MKKPLALAGKRSEIPLYTKTDDELEARVREMTRRKAEEIGGKLSFPSKMDCPAWGIPAKHCRVGAKLAEVEGSTCSDCYAMKGSFTFPNVEKVLQENLVREYKTDRQLLSPHAPKEPGAHDDAPTMLALDSLGAGGGNGSILVA